jgi:hypothetical protein
MIEGQLFKHPIEVILVDGPCAGEKLQPVHSYREFLDIYKPNPVQLFPHQYTCIPLQLSDNVFRYKFQTCSLDMRTFIYKYDE